MDHLNQCLPKLPTRWVQLSSPPLYRWENQSWECYQSHQLLKGPVGTDHDCEIWPTGRCWWGSCWTSGDKGKQPVLAEAMGKNVDTSFNHPSVKSGQDTEGGPRRWPLSKEARLQEGWGGRCTSLLNFKAIFISTIHAKIQLVLRIVTPDLPGRSRTQGGSQDSMPHLYRTWCGGSLGRGGTWEGIWPRDTGFLPPSLVLFLLNWLLRLSHCPPRFPKIELQNVSLSL